jgi:hypothetical protein
MSKRTLLFLQAEGDHAVLQDRILGLSHEVLGRLLRTGLQNSEA